MKWTLEQKCLAMRRRIEARARRAAAAREKRAEAAERKRLFAGMRRATGLGRMRRAPVNYSFLRSSLGPR